MRLASIIREDSRAEEVVLLTEEGMLPLASVPRMSGRSWPAGLLELLEKGLLEEIRIEFERICAGGLDSALLIKTSGDIRYAPPYRHPRKIWGIGANYTEKAAEMAVHPQPDEEPICFQKPDTSLIGPGTQILLPREARRVTAEAELAMIIGSRCKNIEPREAMQVVGAFAACLDMTEKEIHARNPRYLGRSKSFDTFFSFGPELVTPEEIPSLQHLTVETVLNGQSLHGSHVANMRFSPAMIVSFFSKFMTLLPGDILLTGTPGSVEIEEGDTVECRIEGFLPLSNPVGRELDNGS